MFDGAFLRDLALYLDLHLAQRHGRRGCRGVRAEGRSRLVMISLRSVIFLLKTLGFRSIRGSHGDIDIDEN